MEVELQVSRHVSGRLTLQERRVGASQWEEVKSNDGLLITNLDRAEFYRAVAQKLAGHAANGISVRSYKDVTPWLAQLPAATAEVQTIARLPGEGCW